MLSAPCFNQLDILRFCLSISDNFLRFRLVACFQDTESCDTMCAGLPLNVTHLLTSAKSITTVKLPLPGPNLIGAVTPKSTVKCDFKGFDAKRYFAIWATALGGVCLIVPWFLVLRSRTIYQKKNTLLKSGMCIVSTRKVSWESTNSFQMVSS